MCQEQKIFQLNLGGEKKVQPQPTVIHSETVESVDHIKYLGTVADSEHWFSKTYDSILKKSQQRQ